MTRRLEGSAAVITGGAAGLGYAYARRFLEEGACVFIADITDPAAALRRLGAGDRAAGCRVDVASAPSVAAMVDEACRRLGRIDVLVNNAAVFATLTPQPFDAIPEEEWDRVMAVNVRGMWNCVKAVAPVMRFVCNIGDLMQHWTNDRWISTMHRVVNPPRETAAGNRRLSIPFFHQPNYDALIECLPSCCGPDNPPRYEPVTSGQHRLTKFLRGVGATAPGPRG